MKRKKIAFVWQGITGRYGVWNDGLRAAMKIIEKKYDVSYHEPSGDISGVDAILYWEAPCTINGKDSANYLKVRNNPTPKALLFAGGPIKKEWLTGFDHVFVESKLNADELAALGVPHSTAFGVNTDIFFPKPYPKKWDAMHQATCASWKRQSLLALALGEKALIIGRFQESDPAPFELSEKLGAEVRRKEEAPTYISRYLNESYALGQTSDYWGGGQRATLEALACNTPVVCMEDSPKNREYVEESGCGIVVKPDAARIKEAVEEIKTWPEERKLAGRQYVLSKWTHKHYAENLLEGLDLILNK